jgi:hypothetical protein
MIVMVTPQAVTAVSKAELPAARRSLSPSRSRDVAAVGVEIRRTRSSIAAPTRSASAS